MPSSRSKNDWIMLMRPGRNKMLETFCLGEIPGDFLYGYSVLLEKHANTVLWEFDSPNKGTWLHKLMKRIERMIRRFVLFDLRLSIGFHMYRRLLTKKIVLSNIDSIGLSIAFFRWLVPSRCQQIHISQGLSNELELNPGSGQTLGCQFARVVTRFLVNEVDRMLVLGKGAVDSLLDQRICHQDKIKCVQFGVDTSFWTPGEDDDSRKLNEGRPFLLSVGSDAGRDYTTLLQAKFDIDLFIVSRTQIPAQEGVTQISDITDQELREYYRQATMVVIPLKDISQPSGQSATLQSMACGTPVVISDTKGFWDRERILDQEHICLVPHGNAVALSEQVNWLLGQPDYIKTLGLNAKKLVHQSYDMKSMGNELFSFCRERKMNMELAVV